MDAVSCDAAVCYGCRVSIALHVLRLLLGIASPSIVTIVSAREGASEGLGLPTPRRTWIEEWNMRNHERGLASK